MRQPQLNINPTARHEEARTRFEEDVARKLMGVIEKKKIDNLKVSWRIACLRVFSSSRRLHVLDRVLTLHESQTHAL